MDIGSIEVKGGFNNGGEVSKLDLIRIGWWIQVVTLGPQQRIREGKVAKTIFKLKPTPMQKAEIGIYCGTDECISNGPEV